MINQVGLSAEEQAVTIPELAQEGAKDPQYTAVLEAIKSDKGFPEKEEECPQNIVPFFQVRRSISIITQDELEVLTFTDCKGRTRLVVPKSLRGRVKAILHADHRRDLAQVRMRAEQHMYWPRMFEDLKSFIEQCKFCQIHAPSHQKEPLQPTKAPEYPFQQVAADFFEVKSFSYLVYVDRYSGWNRLAWFAPGKATSSEVIKVLREEFMDMGVPEEISCDRGSNLVSREITDWLKTWDVTIRDSSVHYPQSNGRAECAVKQAKKLVYNNVNPNGSLNNDKYLRAQLAYRNSVIYKDTGKSIAQTLLGRHLRGDLPQVSTFYHIDKNFLVDRREREKLAAKQNAVMKKYFDRGSRPLAPLNVGDRVRIQNHTTVRRIRWDLTGVITQVKRDRQYVVMVDGSRRLTTRNRRHLRLIPDPINLEEPRRRDTPAPGPAALDPAPPGPVQQPGPGPAPILAEPVPQLPPVPAEPAPQLQPAPVPAQLPPVPPATEPPPVAPPRRSTRESVQPSRLEVRPGCKSYSEAVQRINTLGILTGGGGGK